MTRVQARTWWWSLAAGWLFLSIFAAAGEAIEVATESASSTWSWTLTLAEGREFPIKRDVIPGLGEVQLAWFPERNASGTHLGWTLVMGEKTNNRFIDPNITHGPQPCEFFGWQFVPVAKDPCGLSRDFRFEIGVFEVVVLDYEVRETRLVKLSVRCRWLPAKVYSENDRH